MSIEHAQELPALSSGQQDLLSKWLDEVQDTLLHVSHEIHQNPEIRFEAARSLGMVGNEDDVTDLGELVEDDDSDVRRASILALGEIGGPGAVRILRALANREDESVADLVRDALDNAQIGSDPLRGPS